jgi:hypothetical protein
MRTCHVSDIKSLATEAPTGAPGSLTSALFRLMNMPTLTSEEVQQWFQKANVAAPPREIATNLANKITGLGPTIALLREIRKTPRSPSNASVGNAIRALRNDLPGWLEEKNVLRAARRVSPNLLPRLEEHLALFATLRDTIELIVREGLLLDYVLASRRYSPWHGPALYLGEVLPGNRTVT